MARHVCVKARYGSLFQDLSTPKVVSDPPCGLLENAVIDTSRPLQCRPRLGPPHRLEELRSGR